MFQLLLAFLLCTAAGCQLVIEDVAPSDLPLPISGITNNSGTVSAEGGFLDWGHWVEEGDDRLLLVTIAHGICDCKTTVQLNGTDLTQLHQETGGGINTEIWFAVGPPVGDVEIAVVIDGGAPGANLIATSLNVLGASQTNPFGSRLGASDRGNRVEAPDVSSRPDDLVFAVVASRPGAPKTIPDQELWTMEKGELHLIGMAAPGAESVALAAFLDEEADWVISVVEILSSNP